MSGRMGRNIGPIAEEIELILGGCMSFPMARRLTDAIVRLIDAKLDEGGNAAAEPLRPRPLKPSEREARIKEMRS